MIGEAAARDRESRRRAPEAARPQPPRLADLSGGLRCRLDEIRARAASHVADFLPRAGGSEAIDSFAGPAHWSHHGDVYEPMISAPAWSLLGRESKRWRGTLAILMLETFGERERRFEAVLAVIAEFIHTASLIVDDIEDGSLLRRGEPAVHKMFGIDVALNAANAMYFLPLQTIARDPHLTVAQREELYRVLIDYFVRGHFGQANDIYFSNAMSPERLADWLSQDVASDILQMYAGKTACWPMGLTEAAAIMAGAPATLRTAGVAFARELGVAFQIMDDVLGVGGMPGKTKTPGEDIAAGKLTYLTHQALVRLRGSEQRRLLQIIGCRLAADDDAILEEGIGLIERSGAVAACRAEAWERFVKAWADMERALPPTPSRTLVGALCADLVAGVAPAS